MLSGKSEVCQMEKGRMLLFAFRMGNKKCNTELLFYFLNFTLLKCNDLVDTPNA